MALGRQYMAWRAGDFRSRITKQILGAALISIRSSSPKLKSARSYDSMKPLVSTTRIEMAVFTGEPPTQKGAIRKTLKEHKKGKITNPVSIKLIKENPINVSRSGCRRDWPSASVFGKVLKGAGCRLTWNVFSWKTISS